MQKTLKRAVSVSGRGLFTGEPVSVTLIPAAVDTGILFQRIDLPGSPFIPATLETVQDTFRFTRLGFGGFSVAMVEHFLSALNAFGITNLRVTMTASEMPACDGSAKCFVNLIEQAGVATQNAPAIDLTLDQPLFWSEGEIHLVALPSEEFRVSYTLHHPKSSLLCSQYFSFLVKSETFRDEIAPCRTFALCEEVVPLIEKGFIKGGGLENAVVIKGKRVLNREGLRFPDEMVRHKVLDLIGDLCLLGGNLKIHVLSVRSGHTTNIAFAKLLSNHLKRGT